MNQFTLSNGLKVIHKELKQHPLVAVKVFLRSGSINETVDQAGLANFTQVLLLQGTKSRSSEQLSREIEDIGGSLSVDAAHDYSFAGISLMDSYFEKAVEILSDIVLNPIFENSEIEKERINILAGIKSRQDSIFHTTNDLLNAAFYGDHPYSLPEEGKAEAVSKFTKNDITEWHGKYFKANNMVIVVTGNISFDIAKQTVEKYFSSCKSGEIAETTNRAIMPSSKNLENKTKKFQQAYLMMAFPAPDIKGKDYPVLKVANSMLGGRMTGILFMELREKLGLAYEVSSFYPSSKQLSRFVIYLGLRKENLELAKNRINELLVDLRNNPIDEKELQDTKNYIKGVYLFDHQTIDRIAWHIGWWEIMGHGFDYDEKYLSDLMAVTPTQIQTAAQKYLADRVITVETIPDESN